MKFATTYVCYVCGMVTSSYSGWDDPFVGVDSKFLSAVSSKLIHDDYSSLACLGYVDIPGKINANYRITDSGVIVMGGDGVQYQFNPKRKTADPVQAFIDAYNNIRKDEMKFITTGILTEIMDVTVDDDEQASIGIPINSHVSGKVPNSKVSLSTIAKMAKKLRAGFG